MDASAVEDEAAGRGGDLLMARTETTARSAKTATADEVAEWLGVDAPAAVVSVGGVSSIEEAGEGSVVFASEGEDLLQVFPPVIFPAGRFWRRELDIRILP